MLSISQKKKKHSKITAIISVSPIKDSSRDFDCFQDSGVKT